MTAALAQAIELARLRGLLDAGRARALNDALARLSAPGSRDDRDAELLARVGAPEDLARRLLELRREATLRVAETVRQPDLTPGTPVPAGRPGAHTPLPGSAKFPGQQLHDSSRSPGESPRVAALLRHPGRKLAGAVLGPWRIEEELARGGMGVVARARREDGSGEVVALKVLLTGERASETQRKRFEREAEALRKLDHPGIVRVVDAGESDGLPWLAMELVQGQTLAASLRQLSPRALARTLALVARALDHAHARGVTHRDLKPSNVIVRDDGAPVVTDFGVAHDLAESSALTKSGAAVGTPHYMAPEQTTGGEPTPATDVYALGVLLYEGLCGSPPFEEDTLVGLFRAIVERPPPPPSSVRPGVPRALERSCLRAMAKAPASRHRSAGALAAELEAWLAPSARAGRSSRGLALALGAVVLGASALGLAWGLRAAPAPSAASDPPTTPTTPTTPTAPTSPAPPPPSAPVARRTLVLQPGPLEGLDAEVHCDGLYANDNAGAAPHMRVGDRATQRGDARALLRFVDLRLLPRGTPIERATLALWLAGSEEQDGDVRLLARALTAASGRTPWLEGTSRFDEHVDGVCWAGDEAGAPFPSRSSRRPDLTQPDADVTTDWGRGPGGVVDEALLPAGAAERWVELDLTPLVRAWVAGDREDIGLQLAHAPEGAPWRDGLKKLVTSDHPDASRRPRLTIDYTGPPLAAPDRRAEYDEARAAALALVERARAAASPEEALALSREAVARAPFLGQAFWARGRASLHLGLAHAGLDLRLASWVSEPVADDVGVVRDRALVRLRQRAAREVLEDCQEIARRAPGDPLLPWLRATALLQQGDAAAAHEAMRALKFGAESARGAPPWGWEDDGSFQASIQRVRGEILLALSREPEGIDSLNQACLLAPGASLPALTLASAHARARRFDAARAVLEQALARGPNPALESALRELTR